MTRHGRRRTGWVVAAAFALAAPLPAQEVRTSAQPAVQAVSAPAAEARRMLPPGQETRVEGIITSRDADSMTLRDTNGSIVKIQISGATQIKEKKSNFFRDGRNYRRDDLVTGLRLEAKGYGSSSGELVAREIRFRDVDLMMASSLDSRVAPVEGTLKATQERLTTAENDAKYLNGKVSELSTASGETRRELHAVGEKANEAHAAATSANFAARAANERIGTLDDFDIDEPVTLYFKAGSTALSAESMSGLDSIAEHAKELKGFAIEVRGFASADGNEGLNQRLSRDRADAVVRYLVDKHGISVRRILLPFGYGESQPVADNKTKDGRRQNRRVEVRILVNRGLTTPATQISAQSGPSGN